MASNKKYALNVKTGEVTLCTASVGSCPHQKDSEHFSNESEARAAYEEMNQPLSTPLKKSDKKVSLDSIMDVSQIQPLIKNKYLRSPQHPKDDTLRILCYAPRAQMEGKWNNITRQARGLIVQSSRDDFADAVVVQRPWEKFYTLSQMESGWHLGDDEEGTESVDDDQLGTIDFNAKAEVTDKLDGSMLVLYRDPDGQPAVATKGSFDMPKEFNKHIQENENMYNTMNDLLDKHSQNTFIFEGVSPTNRIVLKYDKRDIRLIGITQKKSGLYVPLDAYNDVWSADKGLNRTSPMKANTLNEALALPPRQNAEGIIVRIITDDPTTQKQIKIKQEDYLALHKVRTNFSPVDIRNAMREENPSQYEVFEALKKGDSSWMKSNHTITNGLDPKDDAEEIERRKKMLNKAFTEGLSEQLKGYEIAQQFSHIKEKKDAVMQIQKLDASKEAKSTAMSLHGLSKEDLKQADGKRFITIAARKVGLDILDG